MSSPATDKTASPPGWTFVTNHAAVLLSIARDPEIRLRDVAERVGITERAAQRIVRDLVEEGYVERRRVGRRNVYSVVPNRQMRHRVVRHHQVGALLRVLAPYAV
ncbi:MAG: winged helix-turn-helix transcriptional regulator [Actinobacteria bacterium]|nr:MAG: winged helix-turn-helix transcriptional regulator [Actinomycetota bacterium]